MCGIVGYVGEKKAQSVLVHGLSNLEYRGYDSAGVAIFDGNEINIVKCKGALKALQEKLSETPLNGNIGIGHTRWATHGEPSDLNSHPHANITETVAVVHNGIIENFMALKDDLKKEGYSFISDTDTETAAHLIDFYCKLGFSLLDAVFKALEKIEGSYALSIVSSKEPNKIIAARKDAPLIIGLSENENFVASDVTAILKYTNKTYVLEDYEIAVVTKDDVKIYDKHKKLVKKDIFEIDWDIEAAEKGGYEHFMLKEIFEQPKVVKDTINVLSDLTSFDLSLETLRNIDRIYIVACGTAYHAGLIGKHLLEKVARIPVSAEFASEFRYNNPIVDEKTLFIVISQSGETADTLAALRLAKQQNAKTLGFVNVVGSSIAREVDTVVYTLAGPEISVASTKAFSTQVASMYMFCFYVSKLIGKLNDKEFDELTEELKKLPQLIDNILQRAHKIEEFANEYLNSKNVFYTGRGLDYIVAMEGSLKLKEVAYLHSEPYAAGELKHGPIALLEPSTLVIALATQEALFDKVASNIKECKARSAKVLAIAMEDNIQIEKYVDEVFYIPRTHTLLTSILANIPQQLFAYYVSKGLSHDVDKPRNLAKSVTVE